MGPFIKLTNATTKVGFFVRPEAIVGLHRASDGDYTAILVAHEHGTTFVVETPREICDLISRDDYVSAAAVKRIARVLTTDEQLLARLDEVLEDEQMPW